MQFSKIASAVIIFVVNDNQCLPVSDYEIANFVHNAQTNKNNNIAAQTGG
jgi:hypothetical protein